MRNLDKLESWRILLIFAALNLVVLGGYAAHGLFIEGARGIPAAGLVMVLVGAVAIFVVALVAAMILKTGIAKNVVSAALVLVGVLVMILDPVSPELTASGIIGTTFVVIVVIGGVLGIYEENV